MKKSLLFAIGALLLTSGTAHADRYSCTDHCYPIPNMIGDFITLPNGLSSPANQFDYDAMTSISGGAGRVKASQNNNVLLQDRIFVDHSWSDNSLFDSATDSRDHDLHQTIFGLEKVFGEGRYSIEVRLPMINGYDSDQSAIIDQPAWLGTEFGNLYVGGKTVIRRDENSVLTGGLGVTLPTGSSSDFLINGTTIANIENETAFLQPYLAYSRQNGPSFFQMWTQLDFAVGGNDVYLLGNFVGSYQQQNLLSIDMQYGRWLFYDPSHDGIIKGIAPVVELHYTTTMNDTDNINLTQNYRNPYNRMDFWNVTAGLHMQVTNHSNLRFAASLPVRNGSMDETHASDVTLFLQWDVVR